MTPEERLDRVERALTGMVEVQRLHTDNLGQLMQTFSQYVDSADARMRRVEDNIIRIQDNMIRLEDNMVRFEDNMQRIETNLDGLIRAILSEHTNGKSSH